MTKDFYRFIHISDIHFGQEKNGTMVIHEDARKKLIERFFFELEGDKIASLEIIP